VTNFTDEQILEVDKRLALDGVPFHARPLRAAMELLGSSFSMGRAGDEQVDQITSAYERLIPEVRTTWPGMGTGFVASIDRVKTFTVGIIFGTPHISIHEGIGFKNLEEWNFWCRRDSGIRIRSAFAFSDTFDLRYGTQRQQGNDARKYWYLAADQLKLVADGLARSGAANSSIVQPICMSAELAMKAALLNLGATEDELRDTFGHKLIKLAREMNSQRPYRNDGMVLAAVSKLPNYVGSRYSITRLSRIELVSRALDAQFIAAASVRRFLDKDFESQIEATQGARSVFF
jgi:hypothetical protein